MTDTKHQGRVLYSHTLVALLGSLDVHIDLTGLARDCVRRLEREERLVHYENARFVEVNEQNMRLLSVQELTGV